MPTEFAELSLALALQPPAAPVADSMARLQDPNTPGRPMVLVKTFGLS